MLRKIRSFFRRRRSVAGITSDLNRIVTDLQSHHAEMTSRVQLTAKKALAAEAANQRKLDRLSRRQTKLQTEATKALAISHNIAGLLNA